MTHAVYQGIQSIRWNKWKLIPEISEFYNLEQNPDETVNQFEKEWAKPIIARLQNKLDENLRLIEEREEKTDYGRLNICFPIKWA